MTTATTPDPRDITTETSGHVTTIRLARPAERNSFTVRFMDSLLAAVEAAVAEERSRVLVITGGEAAFSVGGDLGEFAAGAFAPAGNNAEQQALVLRRHARVSELLRASDKVSIAAIGGPCAGAGLALAAACDLRIASERAVLRPAFIDAALASDYGAIWLLTNLLGEARAKSLVLLNDKLDAQAALAIGLVSRVCPAGELDSLAATVAAALATKAPAALATSKRLFGDTSMEFGAALDSESLAQKTLAYTSDAREAAAAFLERRPASFTGF